MVKNTQPHCCHMILARVAKFFWIFSFFFHSIGLPRQSLQNLQPCRPFFTAVQPPVVGRAPPTSRPPPAVAEAAIVVRRRLHRIVVSSDGLEGKGLSWLSLSLRPCQAPALLTFQPSRPGSLPRFSSTSQDLLQTIALH